MITRRRPPRSGVITAALAGCLLCWPPAAASAQEPRLAVFVSHSGADEVGAHFSKTVGEALGRSSVAAIATAVDQAHIVLAISTLDPNPAKPGVVTAASWTLLVPGDVKAYLGSGIVLCDQERLQKGAIEVAERVVSLLRSRGPSAPGSAARQQYEAQWNDAVDEVAETIPEDACGIKARTAFREQLDTYLRLSLAASLKLDVREVIKSVASNYSTEDEFGRRLQAQAARLAQCQAELAALKKK
jgi:hypothetical protein